jgi:uncharacterized membrane protein YphA (DoxX/SURF4 family)
MIKKNFLAVLCTLMGVVFIFSGYTKLYPIEPFEFTFVDIGIINWQTVPFVARILIGLEFLIGILFLFNFNLHKIAYKLAAAVLIIFSIYLILIISFSGNEGNCGCFGESIQMTPLQALIKNIIMLSVLFVLNKYYDGWELRWRIINPILFVTTFTLPFILNPVELDYSAAYLNKPSENFKLELDSLYNNAKLHVPPRTLSNGKHIISFMSLKCPHCRIAAKKISIIHKRNPAISFYFVLNGEDKNLQPFFDDTHSVEIPFCMSPGRTFLYLSGGSFPAIYLVNNGIVEHEIDYLTMDQDEIEKWIGKQ